MEGQRSEVPLHTETVSSKHYKLYTKVFPSGVWLSYNVRNDSWILAKSEIPFSFVLLEILHES